MDGGLQLRSFSSHKRVSWRLCTCRRSTRYMEALGMLVYPIEFNPIVNLVVRFDGSSDVV
jgi:hypothetical protein